MGFLFLTVTTVLFFLLLARARHERAARRQAAATTNLTVDDWGLKRWMVDGRYEEVAWDELQEVETEDFTLASMPARFAELGDLHAGIDDAVCDLRRLQEAIAFQGNLEGSLLNFRHALREWYAREDSNLWPSAPEADHSDFWKLFQINLLEDRKLIFKVVYRKFDTLASIVEFCAFLSRVPSKVPPVDFTSEYRAFG